MRTVATLVGCLLCASPVAFAQDFDEDDSASINMGAGMPGMGGMNVQIDVNGGRKKRGNVQVEATASRREEITSDKPGESFRLVYEDDAQGKTTFKFLAPEGAQVKVVDGFDVALNDTIPAVARVRAGNFYRVEVRQDGYVILDKKFEAKEGMVGQFWVRPSRANVNVAIAVQQPAPAPAMAAPPPPRASCMDDGDFDSVKEAVEGEAFSEGKVNVLQSAISDRYICVNQVVELLELYSFSSDKIAALKAMAPAISDKQNRFKIYSALTFDSDKQAAKKILER